MRREPEQLKQRGLTAEDLLTDKSFTAVIQELHPEDFQELANRVNDFKQEAEKCCLDSQKMEKGIQQELNMVVSEIYSPPPGSQGRPGS